MPFPFSTKRVVPRQGVRQNVSVKPIKKTTVSPKPGILGERGYRTFSQLRHELQKTNYYRSAPKYARKFAKKDRLDLLKRMQKLSGQRYGLSDKSFKFAIKKMEKEKRLAGYKNDFKRQTQLDQEIKYLKNLQQAKK